jgi:hypothetical protein
MPSGSIRVDNGDSKTRAKMPNRPTPKIICRVEEIYMNREERIANAMRIPMAVNALSGIAHAEPGSVKRLVEAAKAVVDGQKYLDEVNHYAKETDDFAEIRGAVQDLKDAHDSLAAALSSIRVEGGAA